MVGEDVTLAWYEVTKTERLIKLGVWTFRGEPKWAQTVCAVGGNGRNPVLLTNGHALFRAWIEHDSTEATVWGRWVDLGGRVLTPPLRLALGTTAQPLNTTSCHSFDGEGF